MTIWEDSLMNQAKNILLLTFLNPLIPILKKIPKYDREISSERNRYTVIITTYNNNFYVPQSRFSTSTQKFIHSPFFRYTYYYDNTFVSKVIHCSFTIYARPAHHMNDVNDYTVNESYLKIHFQSVLISLSA